jgi:hypothetical protein
MSGAQQALQPPCPPRATEPSHYTKTLLHTTPKELSLYNKVVGPTLVCSVGPTAHWSASPKALVPLHPFVKELSFP